MDMTKSIMLSLVLLIAPILLFGQEKPVKRLLKPFPPGSGAVETFAKAFRDPNVLIGVFEYSPKSSLTTLSSGEILENLPGYDEAMIWFSLRELRCIKPIKGEFIEPVIFVSALPPPWFEGRPALPGFYPLYGSKWVLALRKTSQEYRIERFGKGIEKYKFFNDRTVFNLFRGGHGALCLKWPEKKEAPSYLVKVSQSIVEDFNDIQQVIPIMLKEKTDPNDEAVLNETRNGLRTDPAKSIFEKLSADKAGKVQDPNDQR
jgi:hypothetical protein